jgi:AraC family transcriptional regulator
VLHGAGQPRMGEMSVREGKPEAKGWKARWYLWDGGFLTIGRSSAPSGDLVEESGSTGFHGHHAIQITLALEGQVGFRRPGEAWATYRGCVVDSDVEHQFAPLGALVAILFVDPESREGNWLRRSLPTPITAIPEDRLGDPLLSLRDLWDNPPDGDETARIIHWIVRRLSAGPPPAHALDPRIARAVEVIRGMDTSRITLDEVARAVFLSPSRFAHLFSEEIGVAFRRYVLWRRLMRAILAVGAGKTLSSAAHETGFSDAAHFTRACTQMLGQPPSFMMGAGDFYEIRGPFELPFPVDPSSGK